MNSAGGGGGGGGGGAFTYFHRVTLSSNYAEFQTDEPQVTQSIYHLSTVLKSA